MSRRGSAGTLTVGSLRGLPQVAARAVGTKRAMPVLAAAPAPIEGATLPPSKRGQRCCRTGCAGCPVGEAIRRARARGTT